MKIIQKLILAITCFFALHSGQFLDAASIYDAEQAHVNANWERSLSLCNELLRETPALSTNDRHHVQFLKAEALLGMKDTNGALRLWQVICLEATESPWRQSALRRQAEVTLFNLKKPAQARELFEEFLDRYPGVDSRSQTLLHLAQARLDTGDFQGAIATLDKFDREFPKHPLSEKAAKLRNRGRSALPPKRDETPGVKSEKQLLDFARRSWEAGNAAEALKFYTELATKQGAKAGIQTEAVFGRIAALESLERYDEAISHSKLLGLRPLTTRQKVVHAATLGRLLFLKRNCDADAEKWLREALALAPPENVCEECRHLLIIVLVRQGRAADAQALINAFPGDANFADAVRHYNRVVGRLKDWYSNAALPDEEVLGKQRHRSTESRLADESFAAMRYQDARKRYARAAKQAANRDESAYCRLQEARCWLQLGEPRKAAGLLVVFQSDAYKSVSWTPAALLRLAAIYCGPLDDWEKSKQVYRRLITQFAGTREAEEGHYYLIVLCTFRKQWGDANRLATQFLQTYPRSAFKESLTSTTLPNIKKNLKNTKKK